MRDVQLFATCLVDSFFPNIGHSTQNILLRAGCKVMFPPNQTCCGQPLFNAGMHREARPVAEHCIRMLEQHEGDVVVPSGSCAQMLKHGYLELFEDDPSWRARAEALSARVFELTEYLVDQLGVTDLGARWDGVLTYHPSCHTLRHMQIDRQPRLLLAHVAGAQVVELPEEKDCCGFGGIFSVEHPELSKELLDRKLSNLETAGASALVLAEPGCLMHISGGLHRRRKTQRVLHIAEVLDAGGPEGKR